MDDTLTCPVCGNKLRNMKKIGPLHSIGKSGNYIERICSKGMNHRGLQFFVNEDTKKVDLLKLPLNAQYSRFLEIDFHNQRCRISNMKENKAEYIDIEKMIEPDFPDLVKLKERISMYVVFS
jgi:hypothetical protein